MKQWETERTSDWVKAKAMALEGWELVSVIDLGGKLFYFFKRELVTTKQEGLP